MKIKILGGVVGLLDLLEIKIKERRLKITIWLLGVVRRRLGLGNVFVSCEGVGARVEISIFFLFLILLLVQFD